jgi:hypothetical protein
MTSDQAEKWVIASALTVAGVYAYRRMTETPGKPPVTGKQLAGIGELPPLGPWATAWGLTYLVVAIMATAAPGLGAAFAILIATGDLLTNAQSIFADVGAQEGSAGSAGSAGAAAATTAAVQAANLIDTPTGVQPFPAGWQPAPAHPYPQGSAGLGGGPRR